MALIIVLSVIAVLVAVIVDFQYNSRVNLQIAANERDSLKSFYLARSAVNISRLILHLQKQVDAMMQSLPFKVRLWELIPIESDLAKAIAGVAMEGEQGEKTGLDALTLAGTKGFGDFDGSFSAEIVDENRKINVNNLGGASGDYLPVVLELLALCSNPHYNPIFETADIYGDYADRMEVLVALRDWIDMDDQIDAIDLVNFNFIPSTAGTEDARYNMVEPSYVNKNAKFDTLEELRMVKGIGDDFMEAFGSQLTVYPVKKINVATAPIEQIAVLILACAEDPNDPALTNPDAFIKLLMMIQEMRFMAPIVRPENFTGLIEGLGIKLKPQCANYIDVTSSIFTVKATGKVGSAAKTITCVINNAELEDDNYLYWRED